MPMDEQENKQVECYYISVESRKGGVGKTTAALNLARMLVNSNEYEVIYFDFDIAGTEIALSEDSLMGLDIWQNYIYMVETPFEVSDEKSDEKNTEKRHERINLVTLFEHYMTGESIPEVKWKYDVEGDTENEGEQKNKCVVKKKRIPIFLTSGKINIFSSKLNREGEGENHTYGPAILFDEMHSDWFLAMIKEIIAGTRKLEFSGKKIVVIIDNAPGYSGLEPAVEEWLTDIGPRYGKFLFICSLDNHDIIGCFHSVQALHDLYCQKWEISRHLLYDETEEIDLSRSRRKRFFYRLIDSTTEKEKCAKCKATTLRKTIPQTCPNDDFCFYRQNDKFGKDCKDYPEKYMGVVVNRIPEGIFVDKDLFRTEEFFEKKGFDKKKHRVILNFLLKKNWIPYLDEYSYLFVDTFPADKQDGKRIYPPKVLLKKLLDSKDNFIGKNWKEFEKTQNFYSDVYYLNGLINIQFSYDNILKIFHDKLTTGQKNSWIEEFFIVTSRKKFLELILDLLQSNVQTRGVSSSPSIKTDHDLILLKNEANEILKGLLKIEVKKMPLSISVKESKIPKELVDKIKIIEMLSFDMAFLMKFKFSVEKVQSLIKILYAMHCIYIGNSIEAGETDIEKYLKDTAFSNENVYIGKLEDAVKEILSKTNFFGEIALLSLKDKPAKLADLYKEFIKTATRFLDLNKDLEFLCECFQLILSQQYIDSELNSKVKKLAAEVIVEKRKTHEKGKEELNYLKEDEDRKGNSLAIKNMNDFEAALQNILGQTQWKMVSF